MQIDETTVFYPVDGEEYCDEEKALAILLAEGVLFANGRQYVETGWRSTTPPSNRLAPDGSQTIQGETVVLFVLCNDIFAWGCADAECLPHSEIGALYRMWATDHKWGSAKWCALRRNGQPQRPIIEAMKKDGAWDEAMEGLPANWDARNRVKSVTPTGSTL